MPSPGSGRRTQQRLLLKWSVTSERFERLAVISKLTAWLGTQGPAVSAPLASRDGQSQVCSRRRLRGVAASRLWHVARREGLAAGERCRSSSRAAACSHPRVPSPLGSRSSTDAARTMTEQITGWIASDPATLSSADRSVLQALVEAAPPEPARTQLVHATTGMRTSSSSTLKSLLRARFRGAPSRHPSGRARSLAVLLGTLFHDWGPVSEQVRTEFPSRLSLSSEPHRRRTGLVEDLGAVVLPCFVPPEDDPTGWQLAAAEADRDGDEDSFLGPTLLTN